MLHYVYKEPSFFRLIMAHDFKFFQFFPFISLLPGLALTQGALETLRWSPILTDKGDLPPKVPVLGTSCRKDFKKYFWKCILSISWIFCILDEQCKTGYETRVLRDFGMAVFSVRSFFGVDKSSWFFSPRSAVSGVGSTHSSSALHEIFLYPLLGYQENWALSQDEYNGARGLHCRIYPSQQYFPLPASVRPYPKEAGPSQCLWRWRQPRNPELCWAVSFLSHAVEFFTYSVIVVGSSTIFLVRL